MRCSERREEVGSEIVVVRVGDGDVVVMANK